MLIKCNLQTGAVELTALDAEEAFWTVKGKDAQVALAVDDHISPGSVEDGTVAVDFQCNVQWVKFVKLLFEFTVLYKVRVREPDLLGMSQAI